MPGTSAPVVATDHARDLDRLSDEIAVLGRPPGPQNAEHATRLASCRVNRASLSGDVSEMRRAAETLDAALEEFGPWPDLCYLRASVHLKQHRLADAVASLALGQGLAGSPDGRAIQADVDLQLGRYADARRAYERLAAETPSWGNLARLAHLERMLGDPDRADSLYAGAVDEITAKELRPYAWVEVQRGLMHLRHGRFGEAERHYERARAAYSGYWVVDEHVAELRAAEGRTDEAIALYEDAAGRAGRPELAQAVGDLHRHAGAPGEARAWHERALAGYLDSARRGEVQYHHHLAEYYADVERDGGAAVPWAERDHALRPHYATEMALAWALHRAGRQNDALDLAHRAVASGVRDPHVLRQAGVIHTAAGHASEGERLLAEATRLNPRHAAFHVHR
jgi:tetratricopeptide (TPR) repeat protein